MHVSLQALKAFESAARLGSFKLAAEELSLTPTAISHHIAKLEHRLSVDLFHREVRKIVLTEIGEKLAKQISQGFRTIENAVEEVRLASNVLKVTTTSSLAALILIPALHEFSLIHPDISVEVSTGETLDQQLYNLPVRLGNIATVRASEVIRYETFNMFGRQQIDPLAAGDEPIVIFTTMWKNKTLAAPPLEKWCALNDIASSNIIVKTFDQELFGIQEALAGNGFVFASTTLMSRLLKMQQIQQCQTQSIQSELCYYIPYKDKLSNRKTHDLIEWLERKLNE
ncbi:DNA-binding transcriptional LysR family regulator [Acinetobacter sp. BIGb0102]|uniref:LysR family transcriptional regulator n=1 Tax=Acinetobacter sp. BIGb0102 TaxID=2485131 RepID=UPI000F4FFC7C|nr:LysR family transcriptional regulator [Acinetobacter sp. BIGb0102]RPE30161.1 DNA-binding transcriptional LysR family regulator [Acinetobacter sp. BIGb0102]